MPGVSTRKKAGELRRSAEERREQVVRAAVAEFAIHGLDGTSTEVIAQRIGISQPYIFRLFPTKRDLFLAAVDQCFDWVAAAFTDAARRYDAGGDPESRHQHHRAMSPLSGRLHAIGHAYVRLLARRELLLFQMQAYAACSDDAVRRKVSQRWTSLQRLVADLSGAPDHDVTLLFARGMFMNVVTAIGLVPDKHADDWGHKALGFT